MDLFLGALLAHADESGDTPRRVKRFVNTLQLLLSVRPALSGEGLTSPRLTLCLFVAVHDGLPCLARVVFNPAHAAEPLSSLGQSPQVPERERTALGEWLAAPNNVAWGNVSASLLGDRLELVRRIGFDPPESFGSPGS